jgi:transcriptional regulator with XRE-family HTH domain
LTRLGDRFQTKIFANCGDGLPQILGRNIRRLRSEKGMSQEELALETGMKRSYVSDMERGTRNPSVKALARLAKALRIEPEILLRRP